MAATAPALADPTTAPDNAPLYGVYDPAGSFADRKDVGIEHVYVPLLDGDLDS